MRSRQCRQCGKQQHTGTPYCPYCFSIMPALQQWEVERAAYAKNLTTQERQQNIAGLQTQESIEFHVTQMVRLWEDEHPKPPASTVGGKEVSEVYLDEAQSIDTSDLVVTPHDYVMPRQSLPQARVKLNRKQKRTYTYHGKIT